MSEKIIQLNEAVIKQELGELVRESVEKMLNELLDQEADRLTNARRYERSEERVDTRVGSYSRKLLNREIRRRTRVVGTFPDGQSALMLVCARLRHMEGSKWGSTPYMSIHFYEAPQVFPRRRIVDRNLIISAFDGG